MDALNEFDVLEALRRLFCSALQELEFVFDVATVGDLFAQEDDARQRPPVTQRVYQADAALQVACGEVVVYQLREARGLGGGNRAPVVMEARTEGLERRLEHL